MPEMRESEMLSTFPRCFHYYFYHFTLQPPLHAVYIWLAFQFTTSVLLRTNWAGPAASASAASSLMSAASVTVLATCNGKAAGSSSHSLLQTARDFEAEREGSPDQTFI